MTTSDTVLRVQASKFRGGEQPFRINLTAVSPYFRRKLEDEFEVAAGNTDLVEG